MIEDHPGDVDWALFRSLADLITGCTFVPASTVVNVGWDSTIGKVRYILAISITGFADSVQSADPFGPIRYPHVFVPNPFQIIRKNKMAFRVLSKPTDGLIRIDKSTLSAIIRGVADQNLNAGLTSELRVIDLVAGNMF
tara:strand:+ start:4440 stop:4856 length:417 start_codon:yes stop_codon:yes gene_type:complete